MQSQISWAEGLAIHRAFSERLEYGRREAQIALMRINPKVDALKVLDFGKMTHASWIHADRESFLEETRKTEEANRRLEDYLKFHDGTWNL